MGGVDVEEVADQHMAWRARDWLKVSRGFHGLRPLRVLRLRLARRTLRRSPAHSRLDSPQRHCTADAHFHLMRLEAPDDAAAAGRYARAKPLHVLPTVSHSLLNLIRLRKHGRRQRHDHDRRRRCDGKFAKSHRFPPLSKPVYVRMGSVSTLSSSLTRPRNKRRIR